MAIGRISGQMLKSNLLRSGTDLAFETNLLVLDVTNSFVGIGTATPARQLHISGTGALRLPSGSDAQRGSSANGDIRYNTDQNRIEGYSNGAWANLASGSSIKDQDTNTGIDVERTSDENEIHFFTESSGDVMHIRDNGDVEFGGLLFDVSGTDIISTTTNGDISLTPNGTGEVNISKVDIDSGAIDGTAIGANSASSGAFTTLTTSGNATIGGNLTVNGTTTTIDSVTLTIEDPLLTLAKNNSGGDANTYDQGLFMNRGSDDNVSFFWDESADQFVFAVTASEDGTTAGNITIDSYANVKANVGTFADVETAAVSAADGTAAITIANSTGTVDIATPTLHSEVIKIDVDSKALTIGAGDDLSLTHDGTNSIISNSTGDLQITGVAGSEVVFNEAGANIDFRVEGDSEANLLVVDASADKIGIGTATPSYVLDMASSTDALALPTGNTSERPTASTGIIRFNSQTGKYEGCQDGSTYVAFATEGTTPIISKVSATGDGSTQTFVGFFASAPASVANVLVFIDNVYQEPTENYSVSSTNITFTSAPHSGARIFAIVGFDNTAAGSGGVVRTETSATNFTSSATTIMSFNATTYRSAEAFITTTDSANTEYEVAKALLVHDGTTAYVTVYGQTSSTGSNLSTYSATLSGGAVLLQAISAGGQQSAKVQYSLSAV
jgi:hypothetical protein